MEPFDFWRMCFDQFQREHPDVIATQIGSNVYWFEIQGYKGCIQIYPRPDWKGRANRPAFDILTTLFLDYENDVDITVGWPESCDTNFADWCEEPTATQMKLLIELRKIQTG